MLPPIRAIGYMDDEYPTLLRKISSPPSCLFARGAVSPSCIAVAIVGTRKATADGRLTARQIAYDLAKAGIVIVSGLAMGIDAAAHEGALAAGGVTIAVLANGLDAVYPASHQSLAESMCARGGALFSEYPEGTPPLRHRFLERNRIVSGISVATVVVEAPIRSGSKTTARLALEQGREVFVVPGSVHHKNFEGSHQLIREGARLVTNARDIADDLEETLLTYRGILGNPELHKEEKRSDDADCGLILEALRSSLAPLTIDNISEITHLETQRVNQGLSLLSLEGTIEEFQGTFAVKRR